MRYRASDIKRLLQEIADKTKTSMDYASFPRMHEQIEEECGKVPFSDQYLYKRIYHQLRRAEEMQETEVSLNTHYVEILARFLSYTGYGQFLSMAAQPVNPGLEKCIGTWYSYVRCNSGLPEVLASPVKIYTEGKEVRMVLKGPARTFSGVLRFKGNCLYCLLEGDHEKSLYVNFKLGFCHYPKVLQGVFSSISSGGDPVAGREILVRQPDKEFEKLSNWRRSIEELMRSPDKERQCVGKYFFDRQKNVLMVERAYTFDLSDLEGDGN